MTKRIIISGAPGTGKTSIINTLTKEGYFCHTEISREIISHQLETGGNITPWQDLDSFSELVINKRLIQHKNATNNTEFYDRSIIDSIAYLIKDNVEIKDSWHKLAAKYKYHNTVFITPPWKEIYVQDNERKEDYETAMKIHNHLIEAYQKYDYNICIIPKMSVEKRIKFIIEKIER